MCTGMEMALIAAGAASTVTALTAETPTMADPAAERAKAEADAATKASAKLSMSRKAMRSNSLLTGAGEGLKSTLGV